MKKLIPLMLFAFSITALAQNNSNQQRICEEGEIVTVARSFEAPGSSFFVKYDVGTRVELEEVDLTGNGTRFFVTLSKVVGVGVSAITNPKTGEIVGCSVENKNTKRSRTCVGDCFYSTSHKKLVFNECVIKI